MSDVRPSGESAGLSGWASQLAALGLELPTPPSVLGAYVPAVRTGNLVFTSGSLPIVDGAISHEGKVGADLDVDEAASAAELCTLNALAAITTVADLGDIVRVVRVTGFVASAPGFNQQPAVIDGASRLLAAVFDASGQHARSAVGVAELPKNASVEVELVVEVRS